MRARGKLSRRSCAYLWRMTPDDLNVGGQALWDEVNAAHELDEMQLRMLEAACRQKDRCDLLAPEAAQGDPGALRHERDSALAMTRLLAALRLPDEKGKRPQVRSIRGAYEPVRPTSLDRARARAEGRAG